MACWTHIHGSFPFGSGGLQTDIPEGTNHVLRFLFLDTGHRESFVIPTSASMLDADQPENPYLWQTDRPDGTLRPHRIQENAPQRRIRQTHPNFSLLCVESVFLDLPARFCGAAAPFWDMLPEADAEAGGRRANVALTRPSSS